MSETSFKPPKLSPSDGPVCQAMAKELWEDIRAMPSPQRVGVITALLTMTVTNDPENKTFEQQLELLAFITKSTGMAVMVAAAFEEWRKDR